jgi:NADH:ubiquinone oxidoreductase subunit F (NADH-binding)
VRDAASEPGSTPYVACNAAEGEPGTYKDRRLMATNPFAVVEGVLIAASVLEAPESYIAVKGHYTHEIGRLVTAREQAIKADWPGADALKIVPGPDDYLYGEEKALLEVIEGKLAMPRLLPPFQVGLWATMQSPNPTVVNNVETFCHAAKIMAEGPEVFRSVGTEASPGTMVFTVIGDVERPGTYEMPLGITLGELLVDIAGADDPKAIVSGTSNPVGTADHLGIPCCFKALSDAGFGLGSGGFIVYGGHRDLVQVSERLASFLAAESCGQCTACKLGTADMAERLGLLTRGEGTQEDIEEITKRTETVSDGARCFLPTGAAFTIRSMVDIFRDEFDARTTGERSPADVAVPVPKIANLDESTGEVVYADKGY